MVFSDKLIINCLRDANRTLALVCRYIAALFVLIGLLNVIGIFEISGGWLYIVIGFSIVVSLVPTVVFDIMKEEGAWAKYLVLTLLVIISGALYTVLSYHAVIMLVFPLICSCLYSDKKWTFYVGTISVPMIIISHIAAFYLDVVDDEPLFNMHKVIYFGIIPRIIEFIAFAVICFSITKKMRNLVNALVEKNDELFEDQQMLIQSLSELIEAQSQETGQHVKRVSEYTRILCVACGYSEEETWKVSIASMMHDVGKLLVPPEIIEKPGKLTIEEFGEVKKHVDYGKKMLEKSMGEVMQLSSIIAYEHHERWDGTGYKHLKGEEINPYARCVAIADVFDALVSRRPYKEAWTPEEAYQEIVSQSGR